jgi:hypothetical protein
MRINLRAHAAVIASGGAMARPTRVSAGKLK